MPQLRELPERYTPGFLQQMDRRTDLFKRLQANFSEIVEDVGGYDALSHAQLALIERFVFLETFIRNMEFNIAVDPDGQRRSNLQMDSSRQFAARSGKGLWIRKGSPPSHRLEILR